MSSYSPAEIEARWQAAWEKNDVFQAVRSADKPKYYVLEMFPYPSGRIHMGHVRNYTNLVDLQPQEYRHQRLGEQVPVVCVA